MFHYEGDGVFLRLFGLDIRWYAICLVTGMLVGTYLASKEFERRGYSSDTIYDLALWALPAGVVGSRIWYVLFEMDRFPNLWAVLNIRSGGLAIQGGVMAGILVAYLFAKKRQIPFFTLVDCLSPFLILAQGIGRWGNFFNNEAYGYPTDLPWAVLIDGVGHHPTFFYESVGDILIFFFLYAHLRRQKVPKGKTTMLYFLCYGILRFFVEGLRMDSLYFGSIRVAQLLALTGAALGLIGLVWIRKREKEALHKQ